ncbi:MAG: TatD family hydrolase [Myxococcota bacterium]|jgi:TatD DNase family protein
METLFDTHAHLGAHDYDTDLEAVILRAREAGVNMLVTVGSGYGLKSAGLAIDIAGRHENIWATVGVHPHDALLGVDYGAPFDAPPPPGFEDRWNKAADEAMEYLKQLAQNPRVVAIGECGLDYHYDHAPRPVQQQMFTRMIRLANETGKPIVIHDREAHEDSIALLEKHLNPDATGVYHCFSGDLAFARQVLELGFVLSIPGVVTFKKAEVIENVVREIPIERLILETDCPFLAPIPYRGKRNEPAYVVHTARKVAEIKGLSVDDVARITTLNAIRLFRIEKVPSDSQTVDVIAYPIRDSLYLNITNRCTMSCIFCAKRREYVVKGHELKLSREPRPQEILREIFPQISGYRELVFCGFGEPMLRLDVIKEVATAVKANCVAPEQPQQPPLIRINTDGLANLVHGRDVTAELKGLVDVYSVSINAPDAQTHGRICPTRYTAEEAFEAVKSFILSAKRHARVVATAVELPGLDVERIRKLVEDDLGVEFRPRPYDEVG